MDSRCIGIRDWNRRGILDGPCGASGYWCFYGVPIGGTLLGLGITAVRKIVPWASQTKYKLNYNLSRGRHIRCGVKGRAHLQRR
ncbi:hypothetical protein NDU88_001850 [Pleurodeles waltl]|uniref:Uncharacterized protein n=1 Tax=Pleurodeles waltl TaxID=8319 RepID=A0AAV7MLJ0_PLEWA|nr:hypothetical protein NDU88_001850 [Pleurodeles waltl]